MNSSRWAHLITAGELATPIEQCVCAKFGEIDQHVIEELKRNRYDQAPLGDLTGIITCQRLEELLHQSKPLTAFDPDIAKESIDKNTPLGDVLGTLSTHRAVLVRDATQRATCGLLTIADLNKRVLRVSLYNILADLELKASDYIEARCADPWEWIDTLSIRDQAQVVGYWKITERQDVAVGPLAGCTLPHLLTSVLNVRPLREGLQYGTKAKTQEAIAGIALLRNRVMHPVQPLVAKPEDCAWLADVLERVAEMCQRLASPQQ